eukprot:Nk52_evm25s222 gene=Nk52_evmTU25s222
MPARGPVILTEDEIEHLLDLLGRPEPDEDICVRNIRRKLNVALSDMRKGATPSMMESYYEAEKASKE